MNERGEDNDRCIEYFTNDYQHDGVAKSYVVGTDYGDSIELPVS